MFDLAWSEIALIAVVAVVVIGPKDLPDAVRGVAKGIQKLRRMAGEFQGHLDEVVREAKLEDVRDQIRDIRNFDLKSTIEKHVDSDGSISRTFRDDPFRDDPFRAAPPPTSDAAPAAGTEAVVPAAAPPVDSTEVPPATAPAEAAADPADATPSAAAFPMASSAPAPMPVGVATAAPPVIAASVIASPDAAPAVPVPGGAVAEARGLSPFPEPAAPVPAPAPAETKPTGEAPPRPTHTA